MKEKMKRFVKDFLWMENKQLHNLTIEQLEQQMKKEKFHDGFIQELLYVFKQRINKQGEKEFQEWLFNLQFKCPDEFQNEERAVQIYDNYQSWLETEVGKLETETKLSWEEQTADLKEMNTKARKAQLVIRHRLSEIVLNLL